METLDLHGVRHNKVRVLVENFVLTKSLPVKIITGNSVMMKNIVKAVLEEHGLRFSPENDWNLHAWIIDD